jgi:MSHA pilin protein MshC
MDMLDWIGRKALAAPSCQRRLFFGSGRRTPRGFTLVELIVTMIIIGIMAVAVLPRFADRSAFEERGFRDETLALLRWAQKSAVAQRRAVCAALNDNGVALTIASAAGDTADCDTPLALPSNPHGGTGMGRSANSLRFLASGATDQAANVTVTIAGQTIVVEAVTGYVH